MNRKLLIIFFLIAGVHTAIKAQVVYFNGLGRALVTNETIRGNVMEADTACSLAKDTTSARKGAGGYFLFDLGFNVQPNENMRANAIFRVRNEYGGFYGDGIDLAFRQIRMDGIISKSIKYELGDIDLGLTPYTLYNFDEIYHDYEADVFALRRSVVHYENFNFGNKWRVQGAHAITTVKFSKAIEKLMVRGFITRTRKSDFLSIPDRLLMGGRTEIVQSKYFTLGANYTRLVDIPGTVSSALVNFDNHVVTGDYKVSYDTDKLDFSLYGESGFSKYRYDSSSKVVSMDEYFYDLGLSGKYKPLDVKLFASYRNVGSDFSSPAAQTRRIVDAGANTTIFSSLENLTVDRNPILFDRLSDERLRNRAITHGLMSYLPQYNNITPYGLATPNRKGITIGTVAGSNEKMIKADVVVDLLTEVVAVGTSDNELRNFTGIKGGVLFNLHKALKFDKGLALNVGLRSENTTRGGFNAVDFSSTLIDAGLTAEIFKGFDLLAGYKMLTAKGKEFVAVRDNFNQIVGLPIFYDMDLKEAIIAVGMRYRFSKNSYFTAQGHFVSFENDMDKCRNYNINQMFLNYTMIF